MFELCHIYSVTRGVLTQCCYDVGPPYATLIQHQTKSVPLLAGDKDSWPNTGPMLVCSPTCILWSVSSGSLGV